MRFKSLNMRFCLTVAFLLTLILIIIPNVVNAVPSPYLSGDLIGEPIGNFRHLAIIHEKLDFDFRSLNNSKYGIVKATYQIRNDREQTPLELLFVSRQIKENSFTLDGKTVPAEIVKEPKLPDTWKPPQRISGVGGYSTSYDVSNHLRSVWKIKPIIAPGEHLLQVEYLAVPSGYAYQYHYYNYHIAYLLTHVKNRDFSKGLEIEVKLPKKWQVTTSLPMNNVDNVLKASFNKIPADYFVFSTSPYFPEYITASITLTQIIFYVVGLIVSGFVGKVIVETINKRFKKPLFISVIFASILGSIAFAVVAITGFFIAYALSNTFSLQQHLWDGYSNNAVLLAFIFIFFGLFISGLIAIVSGILFTSKSKNR